jgi:hypothetical protein
MHNDIIQLQFIDIGMRRRTSYGVQDGGQSCRGRDRPPPSAVSCVCVLFREMRAGEAVNDRGIEWYAMRTGCLRNPMKEETEDE